ncbi:MAG TPA: hypothetical protein VEW95_09390 [Candidatus Limnocylindrales bacterium]|nr:hypothetical protein [Candidatus Limnocylindrales bacterium]
MAALTIYALIRFEGGFDWSIYTEAADRFDGGLYDRSEAYQFRYSPLLALGFGLLAPIGYVGWTVLHFVALASLPRTVALLALVSWPFWDDVYNGNVMTFVFVAAWAAVHRSRLGTLAFLVLAVLVPRPLMLPLLGWILWNRREWVWPFIGIASVSLLGALLTGWLPEWMEELLLRGTDHIGARGVDWGPGLILGTLWVPIGIVLAVWFTMKGRLGLASLAASPYWLPHYLFMGLLELRRRP